MSYPGVTSPANIYILGPSATVTNQWVPWSLTQTSPCSSSQVSRKHCKFRKQRTIFTNHRMSIKSYLFWYIKSQYKFRQDFLDIQYYLMFVLSNAFFKSKLQSLKWTIIKLVIKWCISIRLLTLILLGLNPT